MKNYIINKFELNGVFNCKEVLQENGEIFLVGNFENQKRKDEYSFIKSNLDKIQN